MRISFDFDSTLEMIPVQLYAQNLVKLGFDVWVTTRRGEDWNNEDLKRVIEKVGIPFENVVFLNLKNKYTFFEGRNDYLWHIDDDPDDLILMSQWTNVIGIDVYSDYQYQCNKLLDETNK